MLFHVKGVDYAGADFSSRFESVSEEDLRAWMIENGVRANAISALPLTTGPYSKLPWLILAFPIFAGLFIYAAIHLVKTIVFGGQLEWTTVTLTVLFEGILGILIYNILLRLGSHYDFEGGRIVQYAKGDCISISKNYSGDPDVG